MTIFQSVILGIIQGLTEFLPISSSGHLIFIPKLFGWGDQGLGFDVMVHMGTLVAVVVYFRKKLWQIILAMSGMMNTSSSPSDKLAFVTPYRRLGYLLLLTIIPAGIVGFFFNDWIETNLRATWIIGVGLIFWGLILFIADRFSLKHINTPTHQHLDTLGWKAALFIACAQAVALIPGTSRSGITMTAGLFAKLDKKSAAEFSFLMSVPIIALAGALKIIDLIKDGLGDLSLLVLVVGFTASAVSGFFAIWSLMKIIQKWNFLPFVVYRVVMGVLILVFLI